jgi:CDP-paratose 2-epimerase
MQRVLVTGSSGLVGSECVRHFSRLGCRVTGFDGNQRRAFFGPDGDTGATSRALVAELPDFKAIKGDVRNRKLVADVVESARPDVIVHAAAQPSHDLAALIPFDDFETNATGTLNLLEATRQYAPEAAFVFLSTNKVYGDAPNERPLVELETRWEFENEADRRGFDESTRIDQSRHSLFGASKLAADLLVQEYGRTFGLKTVCFRCGCLTGRNHAAAEQHGFLAYLVRCVREGRPYRVYGYGGKQVRDNLHAADVAKACALFASKPGVAAVYNLGGGPENSVSVVEAIAIAECATSKTLAVEFVEQPRGGDHQVYYSDCAKFAAEYGWKLTLGIVDIIAELCGDA